MDIRNMIVDLWELAGEPSDLDPWANGVVNYDPLVDLDATSAGVQYYLRQISLAQIMLANWRTRRGRPIRFNKFLTQTNIKVGRTATDYLYTITYIDAYTLRLTSSASSLSETVLTDSKLLVNGYYTRDGEDITTVTEILVARAVHDAGNGWYTLSLRDEVTNIAYTDDGTDYLFDSMDCEVYLDRFQVERTSSPAFEGTRVELPNKFRNIIKITNMDDGTPLRRVESKESLFNPYMTFGIPGEWYSLGEMLYFDQYVEEGIWHTIEYQRLPNDMTALTDMLDIPEEWHEVLILINEWKVSKRMQDKQRANELLAEINRWIETLRTDMEEEWLREQTQGFYIRKEAR